MGLYYYTNYYFNFKHNIMNYPDFENMTEKQQMQWVKDVHDETGMIFRIIYFCAILFALVAGGTLLILHLTNPKNNKKHIKIENHINYENN